MTDQQRFTSLEGTHKARALEAEFGLSNGKEQIGILFEIIAGPHEGKTLTGYFFFTDAAVDRTLESMRYCGWTGDSIVDMTGMGTTEVEIVVEAEEYNGKVRNKVKWVNRASRLMMKDKLEGSALQAFAARLRAKTVASKQKMGIAAAPSGPPAKGNPAVAGYAGAGRAYESNYGPDAPFNDNDEAF